MKKFFLLILLALVAGILLFGFLPRSPGPPPILAPSQTSQIPADWKLYTSSQFGFSFRYPPSWAVKEIEPGLVVLVEHPSDNPDEGPISFDVKGELPYPRAVFEIRQDLETPHEEPIAVAGLSGIRISGVLKRDLAEGSGQFQIFTMLDRAGRLISLDYFPGERDAPSLRNTYETVARSLQFSGNPIE